MFVSQRVPNINKHPKYFLKIFLMLFFLLLFILPSPPLCMSMYAPIYSNPVIFHWESAKSCCLLLRKTSLMEREVIIQYLPDGFIFSNTLEEGMNPPLPALGPVGWGWRINRLHLCRGVRLLLLNVLDMTLNNLMLRLQ